MIPNAPIKIRCRQITKDDLGAIVSLLGEGFPRRSLRSWQAGLARMGERAVPEATPQFGYCLDVGGTLAGVILMIGSERGGEGVRAKITNVASWYVKPDYRAYAHLLAAMALKSRDTTYTNVTAAPNTWPVVEQQGYEKYCNGLFFAFAALKRAERHVKILEFSEAIEQIEVKALPNFKMMKRHLDWGCRVLLAEENGSLTGFVFRRFAMRGGALKLPAMFVIHGPDRSRLIRLSGNFARHFLAEAAPILVMDANGPVSGLRGLYTEKRGRKYVKGPMRPALCDLTDTEFAVFGI